MGFYPHIFSFLATLFILSSATSAFNITQILNKQTGFGNFNSLLSRTGVAAEINNDNTITVLALDDGSVGSFSSRPDKVIANILRVHVLLDYYDKKLFAGMSSKEVKSSDTLYQRTGTATGENGRMNITKIGDTIVFRSAGKNSHQQSARMQNVVMSESYKISVIQVDQAIIPDGVEKTGAPTPRHAPPPHDETPSPSPDSDRPTSDSPSPSSDNDDSDDATSSSPEPSDDGTSADDSDKKKSIGIKLTTGLGGSVVIAVAVAAALFRF